MICPVCGKEFDPADRASAGSNPGAEAQIRYCSVKCQRKARNRRYYQTHRQEIISRNLKNQREAREQAQ